MRIAKAIRERVRKDLNSGFSDALQAAFKDKFDREIETSFNIFSMALISSPVDGGDFTVEQKEFCMAFEAGYGAAMGRASGVPRP